LPLLRHNESHLTDVAAVNESRLFIHDDVKDCHLQVTEYGFKMLDG